MQQEDRNAPDKKIVIICAVVTVIVAALIVGFAVRSVQDKKHTGDGTSEPTVSELQTDSETTASETTALQTTESETTTAAQTVNTVTEKQTAAQTTKKQSSGVRLLTDPELIAFPSDDSSWEMILLNTYYRVSSDADSHIDLVPAIRGSGEYLDSRAAAAYQKMYDAGVEDGVYLTPASGYRSYSLQKDLYNELVDEYLYDGYSQEEAEALASTRRMPPGSSEHNIGIAMDICWVDQQFAYSAEYEWLCENAQDYGFILRYTSENRQYTGVQPEPWHWRYVGVENAKKIKASGLSLEQYLGKVH